MSGIRVLCAVIGCAILVLAMGALLTCGEESTTQPEGPDIRLKLDGGWTGTVDILKAGKCSIDGKDSTRANVAMHWEVDSEGLLTVTEVQQPTSHWHGQVWMDLSMDLMKVYAQPCGIGRHIDSSWYLSDIKVVGGKYTALLQAEEYWCPDDTCIYTLKYNLEKTSE